MSSRALVATTLLLWGAGCGDNRTVAAGDTDGGLSIDSNTSNLCWYDTYTGSGTIELGTGTLQWEPMVDDNVALEYGTQNGFDIPLDARITGLFPGNPSNVQDATNPRTRFHGYFVDTGAAINPGHCGVSFGYVPSTAVPGSYEMARGSSIVFDTALTGTDLFGRQVHVVAEAVDIHGNYAMTEKTVTCQPPPGWMN